MAPAHGPCSLRRGPSWSSRLLVLASLSCSLWGVDQIEGWSVTPSAILPLMWARGRGSAVRQEERAEALEGATSGRVTALTQAGCVQFLSRNGSHAGLLNDYIVITDVKLLLCHLIITS